MTLTQPEQRASNFYDSKYLTEYYDLWTEQNRDSLDTDCDRPIYADGLRKHFSERFPRPTISSPFTVLDVGTGTGRVLINLAADSFAQGVELGNLEFLGVDNEPAMVARAREVYTSQQHASLARIGRAQWGLGEAANLLASEILRGREGGVDMLIFAVGSISHLVAPDEPLRFFQKVGILLRPGSGMAYIPIQNDLISERCITPEPTATKTWSQVEDEQEFESRLYPGLIYKQFPIQESRIDGPIKSDRYVIISIVVFEVHIQCSKSLEMLLTLHMFSYHFQVLNTNGQIIETNNIQIQLRVWREGEVVKWIEEAGLKLVETLHTSHETYYVLSRT